MFTAYDGVHYTPRDRFSVLDISTVGKSATGAKKKSRRRKRLGREISDDVSFVIGTLFGCRAMELEKTPQGGVMYTVLYGTVLIVGY